MEAFFIVRLFGRNTGDLMNMLAKAAPQVARVSEQRHRGERKGGGEGEEEEESFCNISDHLTAVRYESNIIPNIILTLPRVFTWCSLYESMKKP